MILRRLNDALLTYFGGIKLRTLITVISVLAMVALSGCGYRTVRSYTGPSLDDSEVATLKAVDDERFYAGFARWSQIGREGLSDSNVVGNQWTAYPATMKMLPGHYLITMHCAVGNYYAFPSLPINVRKGMTYDVSCGYVEGELGKIKVVATESNGVSE